MSKLPKFYFLYEKCKKTFSHKFNFYQKNILFVEISKILWYQKLKKKLFLQKNAFCFNFEFLLKNLFVEISKILFFVSKIREKTHFTEKIHFVLISNFYQKIFLSKFPKFYFLYQKFPIGIFRKKIFRSLKTKY